MESPLVGIIMGSDSDLPVMKGAMEILEEFSIPFEATVVSAHRTPERMLSYAKGAEGRGLKVIIAGAGGAAHLPGMVAASTVLPVVGVPVSITPLSGLDALLSIVQMPGGVPVASVAINNSKNAGILAAEMLGVSDATIRRTLHQYKQSMLDLVQEKVDKMESQGWRTVLAEKNQ